MRTRLVPVKIRHIHIKNYKGIDELDMDFPGARMLGDPDVFVIGSENGHGKTSVIECCSLLLLGLMLREERFKLNDRNSVVDVPDLLIRAGCHFAEISGSIVLGEDAIPLQMRIDRNGIVKFSGQPSQEAIVENALFDPESDTDDFIRAVCGFNPNPVIENTFMLFHSYRKVQEGNPELGMMVGRSQSSRRPGYSVPMSDFKLTVLRSLMGRADLFEFVGDQSPEEAIDKLNELVRSYVGGTISKLRPSQDSTVDFRVQPVNGGSSFTFDGLSSGQKEIISTLFLIWYHTKNCPSVVLIDEPELHLNAQWHRSFVRGLTSLAPQNQYIIATHSEEIMDSVNEDRRVLLLDKEDQR